MRHRHRRERPDREARHAAKREKLLEAAITVIRRDGPDASMENIAREAGITKPIVYRAFGDREGLADAVAARFAAELTTEIERALARDLPDRDLVAATIDTYLRFVDRDPHIIRLLVQRNVDSGIAGATFVRTIANRVAQALGEGLRARGLDSGGAEAWAYGIVGMVHLAGEWWTDQRTMPRKRLVEYLTALVWDGLAQFGTRTKTKEVALEGSR